MADIKAVLFDIDGTLVDSNGQHVRAWAEAFQAGGYSIDSKRIGAQIGKGTDMLVPALIPNADDDLSEALGKAHGEIFKARYLEGVKPYAHARELLARVHAAGCRIVLASSASRAEVDYYIALLDVGDLVSASTTIDDAERSKPAPDVIHAALERLTPITPAQTIMIGDAPYDAEAAGKCGVKTIAVLSGGFPEAVLREAGAIAVYDDVAALLADFDASPLAR